MLCVGIDLVTLQQVAALKEIADFTDVTDAEAEDILEQVGQDLLFPNMRAAIRYISVREVISRTSVSETCAFQALEDVGDDGEFGKVTAALLLIDAD